LRNNLRNI